MYVIAINDTLSRRAGFLDQSEDGLGATTTRGNRRTFATKTEADAFLARLRSTRHHYLCESRHARAYVMEATA
jgi:hypothetical protein